MSLSISEAAARRPHPMHLLLIGAGACYVFTALLCDWAYYSTSELQWKNFASWLILGGLVFAGLALLWETAALLRRSAGRRASVIRWALLLAAWVVSLINELVHAKDAWASMPEALMLSGLATVLIVIATGLALSASRQEIAP